MMGRWRRWIRRSSIVRWRWIWSGSRATASRRSAGCGIAVPTRTKEYRDHVADLLTSSAEQRLARVLLRLSRLDKKGPPLALLPTLSDQVLAEMVGTTRPRINLFMNRFKKEGFISDNGHIEVHKSLQEVLRRR